MSDTSITSARKMNTSVRLLYEGLLKRGISVEAVALPAGSTLLLFEYKGRQRAIKGVSPDLSSGTGRVIADNKYASSLVARKVGASIPETVLYESDSRAEAFLLSNTPIVVKPLDAAHGNGIAVGVETLSDLKAAIRRAEQFSEQVLLQAMVSGVDLRLLVVKDKVVAATERVPAIVVGDGEHAIYELIERENENPLRGEYYEKPLNRIDATKARQYLGDERWRNEIPVEDQIVQVVGTANIGSGGKSINRTGQLPEAILNEAVRIAMAAGLYVCGVDFLYDAAKATWFFIEINASPSFGLHIWPTEGRSEDVVAIYLDAVLENLPSY